MDWRWITSVTSAGTSIGLIAWGAYAVVAANAIEAEKYDTAPSLISSFDAKSGVGTSSSSLSSGPSVALSAVRTSSANVASDDSRLAGREGFGPPRLSAGATYETYTSGYNGGSSAEDATIRLADVRESYLNVHARTLTVRDDHSGFLKWRRDCARPSWDIARARFHWRHNENHARYCPAFESASPDKGRRQTESRREPGENRVVAKIALILGVAF